MTIQLTTGLWDMHETSTSTSVQLLLRELTFETPSVNGLNLSMGLKSTLPTCERIPVRHEDVHHAYKSFVQLGGERML